MPRGGFGRGGFGHGYRGRRFGAPLMYPVPMGMGSPLLTTLMAGGLGYMLGSNTAQQNQPPVAPTPQPYPYQPPSPAPPAPANDANTNRLAQLQLLSQLYASGTLTNEEFEREKQRILGS